jgi:hypothetical protein
VNVVNRERLLQTSCTRAAELRKLFSSLLPDILIVAVASILQKIRQWPVDDPMACCHHFVALSASLGSRLRVKLVLYSIMTHSLSPDPSFGGVKFPRAPGGLNNLI